MFMTVAKKGARLGFLVVAIAGPHVALAGEYEGRWQLWDTKGQPFEVSLHADGTADGTHNDAMKHGTWAEEGGAALIHWNTGWTTRIAHEGQGYVKTAYKPGKTPADAPSNHSDAKRLEPAPAAGAR